MSSNTDIHKAPNRPRLVTPMGAFIDLVLTVCFFVFISGILREHVFFVTEPALSIATYLASACLSGVFWLAIVCFRVTYRDYKRFRNDE